MRPFGGLLAIRQVIGSPGLLHELAKVGSGHLHPVVDGTYGRATIAQAVFVATARPTAASRWRHRAS